MSDHWIQVGGRQFFFADPKSEDIRIEDIASSLAKTCRFRGHCEGFYSVAQHSVLVSQNVPADAALYGLLHNSPEAYIIDAHRPLKQWLREQGITVLDKLEGRIMKAVCRRFGLSPHFGCPSNVKAADMLLLATEARDLMGTLHPCWRYCEANDYPVLPDKIVPWPWEIAEEAFLGRFEFLTGGKR